MIIIMALNLNHDQRTINMTQEEFIEYRNNLIKTLKENICLVSFKKKDGDLRQMLCTNMLSYLPVKPIVEGSTPKKPRVENMSVISTFDINKKEFRSFIITNMIDIKILNKEQIKEYAQTAA